MIQDALIHKSILLLKWCRLFGVQDENANTWCNPTLYRWEVRGLRLSLEAPIGYTLDMVERFL